MTQDLRAPVLVGCGQITQRIDDPRKAQEPLALMVAAAERAALDAGAPKLLSSIDAIRVPQGIWPYRNPGAWLAEHFGAARVHTGVGPISGSTVQYLLHHAARDIAAGRRDVVLLVAAEAERSKRRAKSRGVELEWTKVEGPEPDEAFRANEPEFGWWEKTHRARPAQTFAMFENALRHERGEAPPVHRARIAALWARLAAVAAKNPNAWIQDAPDADAIATPSASNPMLAYPYTKFLVSNMVVDEGAALILCSLEAARRHGVPEDRIVHLHASTEITKTCEISRRVAYHDQPGIRLAGRRALGLAGAAPEDIAHVDLYSCFPVAVQIAANEIGFGQERDLSVTGGLTFAGGPFNSYVMHSLATMMDRLREDPGSRGFVSGIGGYMAKHGFTVLGTQPAENGYQHANLDAESSAMPTRECLREYAGPAVIETFTVLPDPAGAPHALLAACLTPAGERSWATCADSALLASIEREELCGRAATIATDGSMEVSG